MFPLIPDVRAALAAVIKNKTEQGHQTDNLEVELNRLPDSYDRLAEFSYKLARLPLREDWLYVEPNDWESIQAEMALDRPRGIFREVEKSAARVETAFLSSVCGCMLGKPLEINPTLAEIREGLEAIGEWPLRDYISIHLNMRGERKFHPSHRTTVRENLRFAAPDDDINYTILGMTILEDWGIGFRHDHLRRAWLSNIPPYFAWGPERKMVIVGALRARHREWQERDESWYAEMVDVLNPGDEACGAMIRADAYGYACPGNPQLAAWLAYKDASLTHRRTGIYGAMFAAAAMAVAPVARSPLEIFEIALKFVPQKCRFYKIVEDSLHEVSQAVDWLDGYSRIHGKYQQYAHCAVYQETGTLINSLRFAENIGDGFCKQVSQGNDTDSYGATSGSILGLYFGPGHLDSRWLEPLQDTLHTTLATFHDQCLSRVAKRMSELPARIAGELARAPSPREGRDGEMVELPFA